jgi:ABC-type Fe3+-hydroxamate transport system substrate-binding protein
MVATTGTFIDDMLRRTGFTNVFATLNRYPEITPEQLAAAAPQRICYRPSLIRSARNTSPSFGRLCPAGNRSNRRR